MKRSETTFFNLYFLKFLKLSLHLIPLNTFFPTPPLETRIAEKRSFFNNRLYNLNKINCIIDVADVKQSDITY